MGLFAACGSPDATVHQRAYTWQSQFAFQFGRQHTVGFSTSADPCARTIRGGYLDISFSDDSSDGMVPRLGAYTVSNGPTPGIHAALFAYDESCGISSAESARTVSGTAEITAAGNGRTVGRYDLVLDSGDSVAGTFDAQFGDFPGLCPMTETPCE